MGHGVRCNSAFEGREGKQMPNIKKKINNSGFPSTEFSRQNYALVAIC